MSAYYRLDHDQPRRGEKVHCFRSLQALKNFIKASKLRSQDPEFDRMKFWEIEGLEIKDDDGDAIVQVVSVKEIRLFFTPAG